MSTVMIVGSGAREHVISTMYERSGIDKIIIAPGNDLMRFNRDVEIITEPDCSLQDASSFLPIAQKHKPDFIDVAQDDALAAGTVDWLTANGYEVFGPTKAASRIEWDKAWSREFMKRHNIPHPRFQSFGKSYESYRDLNGWFQVNPGSPIFVKASGLCAGKGAFRAENVQEVIDAIEIVKAMGKAGEHFVIEDSIPGEEFSTYAISDGKHFQVLKSAQDNKRAFNFDLGDQTGGMGAVSPAMVTQGLEDKISTEQFARAIAGLNSESASFRGVLYLGGMAYQGHVINVEFNARWGDPEAQAVLPGITTDYTAIVSACMEGRLSDLRIEQDDKTRVCVVGSSRGYPGEYKRGMRIHGLRRAMAEPGISVFGAAIKVEYDRFYSDGGRLFSIVGEGRDVREARQRAYTAMAHVSVEDNNLHYRTDIAWRDVERLASE